MNGARWDPTAEDLETLTGRSKVVRPDRVVTPHGVAVEAGVWVDDGVIRDIITDGSPYPDVPVITMPGAVVMPGIVDAHHHVEQPFAKAISFGEPAQMWKRLWMPLASILTPETVYVAAKWTFLECLRGGFTTIVDSSQRNAVLNEQVMRAADEAGIRLVASTGINDLFDDSAPAPDAVDEVLGAHLELCATFDRVTPSVACGTVQSTSGPMLGAVARFAAEAGVVFQVHANEHTGEIQHSLEHFHRRPLEHLHDHGALGPHTLIAHATLVTPSELTLLADTGTAVSYNPVASAWKGNAVAPALEMIERGIRVGLGTDATRNDAFRLLDAAEFAQRLTVGLATDDFGAGSGFTWVKAGTAGGAEVAGIGDLTGTISAGQAADLLVLDAFQLETMPSHDLEWELVRFFDRTAITAVLVGGEVVSVKGQPTRVDADAVLSDELQLALDTMEASPIEVVHGPSWHHRPR